MPRPYDLGSVLHEHGACPQESPTPGMHGRVLWARGKRENGHGVSEGQHSGREVYSRYGDPVPWALLEARLKASQPFSRLLA